MQYYAIFSWKLWRFKVASTIIIRITMTVMITIILYFIMRFQIIISLCSKLFLAIHSLFLNKFFWLIIIIIVSAYVSTTVQMNSEHSSRHYEYNESVIWSYYNCYIRANLCVFCLCPVHSAGVLCVVDGSRMAYAVCCAVQIKTLLQTSTCPPSDQ